MESRVQRTGRRAGAPRDGAGSPYRARSFFTQTAKAASSSGALTPNVR